MRCVYETAIDRRRTPAHGEMIADIAEPDIFDDFVAS
jgi:hypothetical protein